jgi:starch synthase
MSRVEADVVRPSLRVLFAASEALPLVKTGGLADVAAALPAALAALGHDVRVVVPGYRGVVDRLEAPREVARLDLLGQPASALAGRLPDGEATAVVVECAHWFERDGGPYLDARGVPYADNAQRYAAFCRAVAELACGAAGAWRADVVHANDWHAGLVPLYLRSRANAPPSLFTIHNLAYQGVFDHVAFGAIGLDPALWHPERLEFYGGFSFMKAGLLYADALTTVSPSYAREILTPEFGERLDGVLRTRARDLVGILNGIDDATWDPRTDPLIAARYGSDDVDAGKRANKLALERELGLDDSDDPLLAFIGRLAWQKGADALLAARDALASLPLKLVVLASGDRALEDGFAAFARAHPTRVAVRLAYDEALAHRIEAGADMLIMPSRYEPCGMNQMYSQRYGTVPLVRRVGGLADSVDGLSTGRPTGLHFEHTDAGAVLYAVGAALGLKAQADLWRRLQVNGMSRDFSWRAAAQRYVDLYRDVVAGKRG